MDAAPSQVKVVVRIRPFVAKELDERCVVVPSTEKSSIELHQRHQRAHAPTLSYGFDGAYDSDSQQEDLFKNEIEPMVGSVFKGINTTIFAYGVTGAGKTFTMQGSEAQPGLIPRVARKVVSLAAQHKDSNYASKCSTTISYLEIYNEKVYDLLQPKTKDLPIREDTNKNIHIPGLAQLPVRTYKDFVKTYAKGCKNRTVAPTRLNSHSSRSHAVLTLTVKHTDSMYNYYIGKLHMIDLAGSEDNRRTDNIGIRMTESSNINKSLFVLGKVVNALNDGSSQVPYRDSKLTRLLQDSLGGLSNCVMIANISPSVNHFHDTFNTLNFASKSRKIINKPVVTTVAEMNLKRKKRMPGVAGKENRSNGSNDNGNSSPRGAKDRPSSGGGGDGQKIDVSDLKAFIAQKTKEALEQRIKHLFTAGAQEVLTSSSKMENESFRGLKELLEGGLVENNKSRYLEQCFDVDDEDEWDNNVSPASNSDGDSKALLLTPLTQVTTGAGMARRARKYAKKGQYDRAIRCYNRLMAAMPEKELSIRKKIAKLEERNWTEATTPADVYALNEHRAKKGTSTPFQPSSFSSVMSLSGYGKSKILVGPKKLSFSNCDDYNSSETKQCVTQMASAERVVREKIQLKPSPALATATKMLPAAVSATKVLRVSEEEVMEEVVSEQEELEVVSEEEEEEDKNKMSSRRRFREDDDRDGSEDDSDYLDIKVSRQSARGITQPKKVDTDSEEDDDSRKGGLATNTREGDKREEDVLHVVNTGSTKDLLKLHGIGKKRAEAIIDNRPFRRLAELKKIGLGEKRLEAFMKRNVWEVV